MIIRKGTAKDFSGIRKLIREHPKQLMQVHLPKPDEFFIAIADDNIVGCCALDWRAGLEDVGGRVGETPQDGRDLAGEGDRTG